LIPWQVYAGGVAIVVIFAGFWWLTRTLRKQGAMQRDLAAAEKGNDHAREAIEIEERNRALSDDDVDKRLFDDRK
jgi:ABC-type nickel/cobalt efflux system permease component RcnA